MSWDFHVSNTSGPLINRLKYFQIWFQFRRDIRSQSLKNSTPRCAWHHGVKILGLANKKKFLILFSFTIDVFTPKFFLLIVPFKATRDSQRYRFLLRGVHFDSPVWCTPRSFIKIRISRRIETEFENTLTCLPGA